MCAETQGMICRLRAEIKEGATVRKVDRHDGQLEGKPKKVLV